MGFGRQKDITVIQNLKGENMYTIGIVVLYFGKKPISYDAWEATAVTNDTIDFYIFTDIPEIKDNKNIRVITCSFEECRQMIQKVMNFKISLESPYKLCDYKPTYGLVFHNWLKDYDFWGYCDLDVVFGDLREFFTDDALKYSDRCLENGHISLWKNNEKMNTMFKYYEREGENYEKVYKSPDSFYFDEQAGVFTKCLINGVQFCSPVPLRDPIAHRDKFYYFNENPNNQYIIYWENGKLYSVHPDRREELCYAHFFRRKLKAFPISEPISSIKIVPGLISYNTAVVKSDFDVTEEIGYGWKSRVQLVKGNLKKYGVFKMIYRQIWARKSHRYIQKIRSQYSGRNEGDENNYNNNTDV